MASTPAPAGIHYGKWIILDEDPDIRHPEFATEIEADEYAAVHGGLVVPVATNITITEVTD